MHFHLCVVAITGLFHLAAKVSKHKQKLPMKPATGFSGFIATDHCTFGWVVSAEFIMSHPL